MRNPLGEFGLHELRRRRSDKWRHFPPSELPLWVAEMDTPLAPPIRDALAEAIALGDTGYKDRGELGHAFGEFSLRRFGWAPDPRHTRVAPDVMHAIVEVLLAVTRAGDGVVVNPPVYPPFFFFLAHAGRRVIHSPLAASDDGRWRLDLDRLAGDLARPEVTAYLMCNPQNPTGTVLSRAELESVADLAERHGVRLLADEIHAPLVYAGAHHVPLLSLEAPAARRGFAFTSASKGWNLPGLKAAVVIAGVDAAHELAAIPEEAFSGPGLLGVIASEVAFRDCEAWLDDLLSGLDANRHLLARLLADALPGVRYRVPQATYLAWLDCRELGLGDDPAEAFARAGVRLVAGPEFGAQGRGFVRLNFGTSPEIIGMAVERMATVRPSLS